ncbi:hypothetical protein A3Q56_03275 [Intoshia linei]|uniref:CUB domain-containing protein n=1 Tax=Intoshia linei TaxID=1819745 RepID=A0A177B3Y7_9BILA|nr:hypothetical protein A3Q56_03275 [Intoshia linei]
MTRGLIHTGEINCHLTCLTSDHYHDRIKLKFQRVELNSSPEKQATYINNKFDKICHQYLSLYQGTDLQKDGFILPKFLPTNTNYTYQLKLKNCGENNHLQNFYTDHFSLHILLRVKTNSVNHEPCLYKKIKCDGICIHPDTKCDNYEHCSDGLDEKNCKKNEFTQIYINLPIIILLSTIGMIIAIVIMGWSLNKCKQIYSRKIYENKRKIYNIPENVLNPKPNSKFDYPITEKYVNH